MLRFTISRLALGELEALLVAALGIVADEFEEERDLVALALGADALDEGVLDVVDAGVVVRACSRSES